MINIKQIAIYGIGYFILSMILYSLLGGIGLTVAAIATTVAGFGFSFYEQPRDYTHFISAILGIIIAIFVFGGAFVIGTEILDIF